MRLLRPSIQRLFPSMCTLPSESKPMLSKPSPKKSEEPVVLKPMATNLGAFQLLLSYFSTPNSGLAARV